MRYTIYIVVGGSMDKIDVLFTEEEIGKRVKELAETLYEKYHDEEVTFVCTLKGAVFFACDLLKRYKGDARLEFLRVSSYEGESSTGKINLKLPLNAEKINGKNVVVVEDIVDTGYTLNYVRQYIEGMNPKSLIERGELPSLVSLYSSLLSGRPFIKCSSTNSGISSAVTLL